MRAFLKAAELAGAGELEVAGRERHVTVEHRLQTLLAGNHRTVGRVQRQGQAGHLHGGTLTLADEGRQPVVDERGKLAFFAIQGIELLRGRQVAQGAEHVVLPMLLDKFAGAAQGQKHQQPRRAAHGLPGIEVGGGELFGIGFVRLVETQQQSGVFTLLAAAAKQLCGHPIQRLVVALLLQAQVGAGVEAALVAQLWQRVLLRQPPRGGIQRLGIVEPTREGLVGECSQRAPGVQPIQARAGPGSLPARRQRLVQRQGVEVALAFAKQCAIRVLMAGCAAGQGVIATAPKVDP
ncbi:hypothetical protein D3C81_1325340 [compost metagenome]